MIVKTSLKNFFMTAKTLKKKFLMVVKTSLNFFYVDEDIFEKVFDDDEDTRHD